MNTINKLTIIFFAVVLPYITIAQVRPNVANFTPAQRTQLVNAMMEYIDNTSVGKHCIHMMTTGGHIHSDWDFLPFHRTYIEGMEDYIKSKGSAYDIFVPLPKWDPSTPVPLELRVVDPDCANISCDPSHPSSSCSQSINWTPNTAFPLHLTMPNLCNLDINPTAPSSTNCCPSGLSRRIESPWHDGVHVAMSGVMGNFRSPAVPIFWLWHAYVDDVWKTWECNCNKSGMDGQFDLYMKDSYDEVKSERDRGEEPNIDNGPMWESEDIWVRNQDDGLTNTEHQNPEYMAVSTNYNYVYVRVRNRGCIASPAITNGIELRWAKAGTNLTWPNFWNGSITSPALMGNLVSTKDIPAIPAGGSAVIKFAWQPPNPATYTGIGTDPIFWADEPWHFCLLARIVSTQDNMTFQETSNLNSNVKNNNNIVWKNLTVVDLNPNNIIGGWNPVDDKLVGAVLMIGDVNGTGGVYDLEFRNPPVFKGNPLTAEAQVKVTLDAPIWEKWQQGGFQSTNVEISNDARHQIIITGSPARINNLAFDPNEKQLVHFSFNFLSEQLSGQNNFDYQVIQRHTLTNEAIGGERFHIKIPGRDGFYANAGTDQLVSQYANVNLSAIDIGEDAIYNWYDSEGELVYTGMDFTVSADITEKYKLEVIAKSDGVKDYDEIEITVKEFELLSISPNPASNIANVQYKANTAQSAYIILQKPYTNIQNQYILNISNSEININVSGLEQGVYSVILVCDGIARDVKTLVVQ